MGVTSGVVERRGRARELREQGLSLREIGRRMGGVSASTVSRWLLPLEEQRRVAAATRARQRSYGRDCEMCGRRTNGNAGPGRAARVCQECLRWPDSAIIDAMRRWAEAHGGRPPTCTDWTAAGVDHPAAATVGRRGAGWNAFLLAAGFGLRCDRRPETQAWVEGQVRAGVPTREIADALGVTPEAIHHRFRVRGLTLEAVREAGCRNGSANGRMG